MGNDDLFVLMNELKEEVRQIRAELSKLTDYERDILSRKPSDATKQEARKILFELYRLSEYKYNIQVHLAVIRNDIDFISRQYREE